MKPRESQPRERSERSERAPRNVEIGIRAGPSACLNCDSDVTDQFRRVYGDNDDVAHRCGECNSYRGLTRESAAGVDVAIPDPETATDHHGGESPVLAEGRGQMTAAGSIVLVRALAVLRSLPLLMVVLA